MDLKRTGRTKTGFNKLFLVFCEKVENFVRWRLFNDKLKNFPKMNLKWN